MSRVPASPAIRRPLVVLFLLGGAFLVALAAWWAGRAPQSAEAPPGADIPRLGRFPASQFFLEHDLFLAATDPRTIPAREAVWLRPDDEVFGVVVDGAARAYPVFMIAYHHVVNDVIRGIPVAVTY
jgi:hypothetical protein